MNKALDHIEHGEKKEMPDTAPYSNETTSKDAAKKIQWKLSGLRKRAYLYIKGRGKVGATGSEVSKGADMLLYTAKPRCTELFQAGYIEDSGMRRMNAAGSQEIVWTATKEQK